MRIFIFVVAAALTAACGSTPAAAPPTSTPTSAPTTTTTAITTTTSAPQLYDLWNTKFALARKTTGAPCAPALVQTQGCAEWLTDIVLVATALQRELKGKPPYAKTLAAADKVVDAGSAYGDLKCRQGGGTFEMCQAYTIGVAIGSITVTTTLMGDDIGAR